ncbi:hypothetical protein [Leifsonia sp. Leaf264]|uniref:hypothetical protein n=1 Tax=Leifsonia sp. Leaf264 TaxID=1736314 RepID=UPI000A96A8A8|nr:hypothetical protein [Leifsonia sp. Leaf264]
MTDTLPMPAVEVVWRTYRIEREKAVSKFRGFLIGAALSIPVWAAIGTAVVMSLR